MNNQITQKDYDALVKRYHKIADKADHRLIRLEGLAHYKAFKGVKEFAYKGAIKSIEYYSGKGRKRFNTKPPGDENDSIESKYRKLEKKIADIELFLSKKTSTKKGIIDIQKRRAETLNNNPRIWGEGNKGNLTWQDYSKILPLLDADYQSKFYTSDDVIESANLVKEHHLEKDNINTKLQIIEIIDNVDLLEKRQLEILVNEGLTYSNFFKG